MAEYIDKEAFIAHERRQMHEIHDFGILCGAQGCLNDLKKFPAADVRELVTNPNRLTNADRIRVMSDEELAFILASPSVEIPPWCVPHLECPHMDKDPVPCDECALEWLRQEVEK